MLQTQFLEQPLTDTAAGVPDKDPRIFRVAQLAERGDYLDAAALAQELLDEGHRDIRTIGYYLFGLFHQGGAAMLGPIVRRVVALLDRELDALAPADKRARVVDSSLSWLFRSMSEQCLFHAAQKGDTWQTWVAALDTAQVEDIASACEELRAAVSRVADVARSVEQIARLEKWLRDSLGPEVRRQQRARARAEASEASAASPQPETSEAASAAQPDSASAPQTARAAQPAMQPGGLDLGQPSPALQALLRKLDAFERLMKRGDMARAAVVAHDIRAIIADFDPLVYFPQLFASFFRLLSESVDELLPYWDDSGSPAWQALEQFYRADLDSFAGE